LDGIEFLEKARETNPDIPVIMISGHGTIETAVEAVRKVHMITLQNLRI
jgi:DNA-binding NtrC family response regulator